MDFVAVVPDEGEEVAVGDAGGGEAVVAGYQNDMEAAPRQGEYGLEADASVAMNYRRRPELACDDRGSGPASTPGLSIEGLRASRCLARATSGCPGCASTYALSCSRSRALSGPDSAIKASIASMACRRISGIFLALGFSTVLTHIR